MTKSPATPTLDELDAPLDEVSAPPAREPRVRVAGPPASPEELFEAEERALETEKVRAEVADVAQHVRRPRPARASGGVTPRAATPRQATPKEAAEGDDDDDAGQGLSMLVAVELGAIALGVGAVAWLGYRLIRASAGSATVRTVLGTVAQGVALRVSQSLATAAVDALLKNRLGAEAATT